MKNLRCETCGVLCGHSLTCESPEGRRLYDDLEQSIREAHEACGESPVFVGKRYTLHVDQCGSLYAHEVGGDGVIEPSDRVHVERVDAESAWENEGGR